MGSPLTTTGLDESRDEPRRPLAPWPSTGLVKPLVLAAAAYTALSVVLTWPLAANLTTHLPHDLGDPVLSSWLLWWHAHHLPFTAAWWDGAGFFPVHGTLALSDHRIGLSLIGSPLIWLGGSGVLAYNVALMFSFAASALAMHGLVLALTRRHDAATLAAVVFGFAPYRFDHVVHLEIVSAYWLPIALLGLHLWLRARETRWLALFSACWLLQALTCGYYFFYFAVLLGLWTVWFLRSWRRDVLPVALAGLATLVPLLPVLLYYKGIHSALGLRRGIDEIELFSADISGLLSGAPWLAGWSISPSLLKAEGRASLPRAHRRAACRDCGRHEPLADERTGWAPRTPGSARARPDRPGCCGQRPDPGCMARRAGSAERLSQPGVQAPVGRPPGARGLWPDEPGLRRRLQRTVRLRFLRRGHALHVDARLRTGSPFPRHSSVVQGTVRVADGPSPLRSRPARAGALCHACQPVPGRCGRPGARTPPRACTAQPGRGYHGGPARADGGRSLVGRVPARRGPATAGDARIARPRPCTSSSCRSAALRRMRWQSITR